MYTGSCCRGAGHEEGEKEGSKGLPGQSFSKCLLSLLPRHGVHRVRVYEGPAFWGASVGQPCYSPHPHAIAPLHTAVQSRMCMGLGLP